jgi:hypothetical protein
MRRLAAAAFVVNQARQHTALPRQRQGYAVHHVGHGKKNRDMPAVRRHGASPGQPPESPRGETEQQAVALVTLALDHTIRGEAEAFTMAEVLAVAGDRPVASVLPLLAVTASIAAVIVRNASPDDDAARDWWQRIARHLLRKEDDG